MSGKSGTQDWFYHAPSKRDDKEPVDYPAASQIPLIGGDLMVDPDRDDGGMKRGWLRETDSKYVRLAKMGGRKDLLIMRTPPPKMDSPRSYPRVEWFDHHSEPEHIDKSPRKVYLPDYMVHDAAHPPKDELAGKRPTPRRAPYSLQDEMSAFKREGARVTDKMDLRLDEDLPYSKRFAKRDRRSEVEQRNKALATQRENLNQRNRKAIKEPDEPVIFGKLLSMGYQQDWNDQRDRHYQQQHHKRQPQDSQPYRTETKSNTDPVTTEYREVINKTGKQVHTLKGGGGGPRKASKGGTKKEGSNPVSAQTDSHSDGTPTTGNHKDAHQHHLQMTRVEI